MKNNNMMLGIVSIIAIVIMVALTISFDSKQSTNYDDLSGQASQAPLTEQRVGSYCKLIVGSTTLYDDSNLATSLGILESTTYAGSTILVSDVNENGCVVIVDDNTEFLALGQIQRVGPLYVTIKDIVQ